MTYPSSTLYPSTTLFPGSTTGGGGGSTPSGGLTVVVNGLDVTATDPFGVEWSTISPLTGWDGGTASSVQLTQKTRAPGAWAGPRNMTPRTISINGYVEAPTADLLQQAIDQLTAAVTLEDFVLTVTRGAATRSVIAARQDAPMFSDITDTLAQWSIQVVAADPRKFTAALTASTGLPATSGGVIVPLVVPLVIVSSTVSGQVTLINPGTATGPVVLKIAGPVVGPQVTHLGTGLTLSFGSSMALAAGEFLLVDMEAQTVLAQGQASRNNTITSRGWSGFESGPNTWTFDAAAYNAAARLTVTATPSWA